MDLKEKAKTIKIYIPALFIAMKREDTPILAKIFAGITVGYALSPIDLIPDFIPVLGYLDDLVILPLLAALAIRFIPDEIMDECKTEAEAIWRDGKPKKWYYAIPIIVLWLIVAGWITSYFLNSIDQTVLFYIQTNLHSPSLDRVMILATAAGDNGLIWILLSIMLIINKKTRNIGITALIALIFSTILGEGLVKNIIQRPRPYDDFTWVHLLIDKSSTYSFPSGHTTSSFAVAYVLSRYFKKLSPVIWMVAILIAFSRLYLFMHYPSDLAAGVILGLICGKVAIEIQIRRYYNGGFT